MQSLLIIGYGNLAHAIVKGISPNTYKLYILGRSFEKSQIFCRDFPDHSIIPISSIEEIKDQSPVILICIKPKGLESFSCNFFTPLVYSVMAGVRVQSLISHFPKALSYVRAMPNVGAFFKKSATTLYAYSSNPSHLTGAKEQAQVLSLAFGNAVWVDNESLIDASIATSGSSPAFLALVAQALIDAGVREGLNATQSTELVQATFEGFAELLKHSTPSEIKTLVTSPAGTTAEGLAYLEERGFKGILEQGAHQSVLKAKGKI